MVRPVSVSDNTINIVKSTNRYAENITPSGIAYRILNAIKHIFGNSDWDNAVKKLTVEIKEMCNATTEKTSQVARNQAENILTHYQEVRNLCKNSEQIVRARMIMGNLLSDLQQAYEECIKSEPPKVDDF